MNKYPLKFYKYLSFLFLIIIIFFLIFFINYLYLEHGNNQINDLNADINSNITTSFSPEIENILKKKLALLDSLSKNSVLIEEAMLSNQKNSNLTQEQIIELDNRWINAKKYDDFVLGFMKNKTALVLMEFQEENYGFVEIFVTNMIGVNIGQTNKTTDYYQADEDWWINAFNNGEGKLYYGKIEYDESAHSESIPFYVPIRDNEKKVIGVIKAIFNILAIQRELSDF